MKPEDVLIANSYCICLEANWDLILASFSFNHSEKPFNISKRMNDLRKIFIFKNLSEWKLFSLAKKMKKEKFKENELILKQGTIGDQFYLIKNGFVRIIMNDKNIRDLESGNYFGEISLLKTENRTASVIAGNKVICYTLKKEDFLLEIDQEILEYIKNKIYLQDTSVLLNELFFIKFLGKGKYGNVSLVHNKKNLYAIKAISRKIVDKQARLGKYFVQEKEILQSVDHPLISKFVKSLKNNDFVFLLLEFINGENLKSYLNTKTSTELRNENQIKFYAASLLIMVDYIHKKNIAHRDIKPSNIMIDKNGYLKLIDFGTSKVVNDFTYTFLGTPHYMSPEILLGKSYSLSTDYWSVGVSLFEIFYGKYPFGNNAKDAMDIYRSILNK